MESSPRSHQSPYCGDRAWPGRALHVHVKERIERELDGRSWSWLAQEIGVPQSTLAGQVCKPKFSLEVVWRISKVLGIGLEELLDPR